MIDLTNQMIYRIGNLDVENERISYQMSTGKVLEKGSDDSVLYGKYLGVENSLRTYEGLEKQIEKTTAQNNVSDSTVNEMKLTLDSMKVDLLKSLNSGMTRPDRLAVASNFEGMRENLLTLANTTVDGEYLFSGSNTTKETFTKNDDFKINGQVEFGGNAHLRNVAVDPGVYRQRGVTAHDVLMYNTDTTAEDNTITFSKNDKVIDSFGNTWIFIDNDDADGDSDISTGIDTDKLYRMKEDGTASKDFVTVTSDGNDPAVYTSEDVTTASNLSHNTQSGLLLETKHNIFEELNIIINALKGYDTVKTDGATNGEKGPKISDDAVRDILSTSLGKITEQYDATNIGHAELGGRNKIFETALSSINTKVTHFNILMQETNGVDMAKLAMESKALEMTYNALYSTVSKMHQLSLVNFIK